MFPRPLIDYLVYFHSIRDYFECHEVLEEHWKEEGQKNRLWVGFIQLAVAMYHHRRNNFVGAERLIKSAIKIFEQENKQLNTYGFDEDEFFELLIKRYETIKNRKAYFSTSLPIANRNLLEECIKKSQEIGLTWGAENINASIELIDKHKLRDRSEIINERKKQLKKRREE